MSEVTPNPQSIAWKVEEVFVQAFKASPILSKYNPVHEDSDDEAKRPAIVVKSIAEIYVPNQTNLAKQLYKSVTHISLKANRAKLSNAEAETVLKRIMDLCSAMRAYPANQDSNVNLDPVARYATSCFSMLQLMHTEEGERAREEQTRSWTRVIPVIAQEIS